jgi:EAL domain-containing protein (putative c-di-GMP-specific phosphodiesterase class I)
LAHNLGLKVIAEGVEDRATYNKLKSMGCDMLQGYFISKPVAPEVFMSWVKDKVKCMNLINMSDAL